MRQGAAHLGRARSQAWTIAEPRPILPMVGKSRTKGADAGQRDEVDKTSSADDRSPIESVAEGEERNSRVTVPIEPEELERLVAKSERVGSPQARAPLIQPNEGFAVRSAVPRTRSSADFASFNSNISDALTSVTAEHPSLPTADANGRTRDEPPLAASTGDLAAALRLEAQGNFTAALGRCEAVLDSTPDDESARQLRERLRDTLADRLAAKLGDLQQIPVLKVHPSSITWHKLDHQAGFLLSQIDGSLSIGDLLHVSAMPRYETLRTLDRLLDLSLIEI